jgi:hypothetical protein
MSFISNLFSKKPDIPREQRDEVARLIDELIGIGKRDDYLSERPGGQFNAQCHNVRARAIGTRLNEIGELELLTYTRARVKHKLGSNLAAHLDYAWSNIGKWMP